MRVVQVTRFGGPEALVMSEAPDPVAGPGHVVIDVSIAEVLFLDTQLRSGWGREYFTMEPPYVPGTGVAGAVTSIGEGVDPDWVGRRVVASAGLRSLLCSAGEQPTAVGACFAMRPQSQALLTANRPL